MSRNLILKGNICHTPEKDRLEIREDAYVVCEGGLCRGIFDTIPDKYLGMEIVDCAGKLIIPGLVDLHTHAPQFAYRGTGMDEELMGWLERYAFPEESRYADTDYAARAYRIVTEKLKRGATTRVVMFATIHPETTLILMDCMEKSGVVSYIGKVNMDRNASPELTEENAARSAVCP